MPKKQEPRFNDTPVDEIPEVAHYESVMARYRQFQADNQELFQYLHQFAEEINTAREAADKAVRARQVSCGDFHFYQKQIKLNAEVAYQVHGHERFLALGGSLETVTKKSLDKTRYMSNVKAGVVTPEEKAAVVKEEARFHKPEEMVIPT